MEALHKIGGVPSVMKYLLKKGFLHGDCMTVTGKTIAENLKDVPSLDFNNTGCDLSRWKNRSRQQDICRFFTATSRKKDL